MRPDIFKVDQTQIANFRGRLHQSAHGWDAASGENEVLNKVNGVLCPLIESFVDRDALNQGQPLRFQHAAADGEERSVILIPHSFDHLDGHEFVELHPELRQVSVIREHYRDSITQAGFPNPL